jgi:RNA polymerase sigma-70 factor (ECF subfamily)
MSQSDDWLIRGLSQGDPEAARVFCERYGPSLQQLADKHLAIGLRRRVGPESICQSACRSFLRRAQAGEYELADAEGLWRLLCAITLTKVREQARFHRRQRRSIDRERSLEAPGDDEGQGVAHDVPDSRLSPAELVEFEEQFELLLGHFEAEEQQLLELKLQQLTNEEAAVRMGCSERTVRRVLQRVKSKLERHFAGA